MERIVEFTVEALGMSWDIKGWYDLEAKDFSYETIIGECSNYLPKEVRMAIEDAAFIQAEREEAERIMGETDSHLEATYEERCGEEE